MALEEDNFILIQTKEGQPGVGVPSAGLTDQVLSKTSDGDYDTEWIDNVAGTVTTTIRNDIIDDYLMYRGDATPGSIESDPVWQLKKLVTEANGDITVTYVNGDADFIYIWDDRFTYNYN